MRWQGPASRVLPSPRLQLNARIERERESEGIDMIDSGKWHLNGRRLGTDDHHITSGSVRARGLGAAESITISRFSHDLLTISRSSHDLTIPSRSSHDVTIVSRCHDRLTISRSSHDIPVISRSCHDLTIVADARSYGRLTIARSSHDRIYPGVSVRCSHHRLTIVSRSHHRLTIVSRSHNHLTII